MRIVNTTATFTRPNDTTAYASGDLVANNTTAGSVTPMSFVATGTGFRIQKVEMAKSTASVTNASFRLHLYKDSPTVANGDNGAWSSTASGWVGSFDITAPTTAFTDSYKQVGTFVINSNYAPTLISPDADGRFYGLLECRGAYTPGALETFTLTLVGEAYD